MTQPRRHVLILAHTGREATVDAAASAMAMLHDGGVVPVLPVAERDDLVSLLLPVGDGLLVAKKEWSPEAGGPR